MIRDKILPQLREFFAASEDADLVAAWLFGSLARGDAREGSDVDVAVLYRSPPVATLDAPQLRTEGDIERLLRQTTQVVALNQAQADFRVRVLRDGVLLLDRDPALRIRFEVQTRKEWFDLQPILQEYRRYGRRSAP